MKLPKYIINSIKNNETSLGDHPSFPPDDEQNFLIKVINAYFTQLCGKVNIDDIQGMKNELSRMVTECQKIEKTKKDALEKLALNVIHNMFEIPENIIDIKLSLVDTINNKNQRRLPERTDDFEFDSIDDMNYLSDEIYKRRMLNALVDGSALYYSMDYDMYVVDLFRISSDLPSLYMKIMDYNNVLMYFEKETLDENESTIAGNVSVLMRNTQDNVTIDANGIIFVSLLSELIKGIDELAIAHGLPEEKNKAEYVMKKADFTLAELWDLRLGLPLWDRIIKVFNKIEYDIHEIGLNFFFMELSCLSPYDFNSTLKEIFGGTKKGEILLKNMIDNIMNNKDKDEFDDYMRMKKDTKFRLSDSEYFSPDELITDCL